MEFIYKILKLNRSINNPQVKLLAVYFARIFNARHLSLRIDPATACNLKCRMCPVGNDPSIAIDRYTEEDRRRLGQMLFQKALQVVIGCGYEPTMHKQFMQYVKMAWDYRVPFIGFTSNGQLLTNQHIEQFIRFGLSELTISVHGVRKETYRYFMRHASYDKLHALLKNLDTLKAAYCADHPSLRINFTINSDNLDEVTQFFDIFGQYHIQTLQIRPMFGDCFPQGQLTRKDAEIYRLYLKTLSKQCAERKVTLIAHTDDLNFSRDNYSAIIYPEVFYYMNPDFVWRSDFAWRNETHNAYCTRIHYNRYLLRSAFTSKKILLQRADMYAGSGRYDVF